MSDASERKVSGSGPDGSGAASGRRQTGARVAVVGCGYWGRNLVRNFHQLGVLEGICDDNRDLADAMSRDYDVRHSSFETVLGDDTITGIAIATPAVTHYDLARQALLAGKHVFVEKPLALNVADAEKLCALADRVDRRLMVGHLLQYHPAFLKLKQMVFGGDLGRLQYIYSNRLNLGKVRREENILWSFAPHDISMILSLAGEDAARVSSVGGNFLHDAIADVTTTHLEFPSGVKGHIFVSWLHPFKEQKLVVVGEQCMAVFDDGQPWERKILVFPHKIDWIDGHPQPAKAEPVAVEIAPDEPLKRECQHFIDCIASGETPITDGREGVRVLRVLQQAEACLSRDKGPAASAPDRGLPDDVTVHETACVDEGCEIGAGTKIWHFSHVLSGSRIGENCVFGQNVMVGPQVTVGNGCKIQNNVSVYKGVTLEDDVFCGPSCVFTNVYNPRADVERKDEFRPTVVRRGATIGANATIVCGVDIGAYSMIGAGAVVKSDVPAHALMVGVPARQIGWVSHAGEKLDETLTCPRSGRRYAVNPTGTLSELLEDPS